MNNIYYSEDTNTKKENLKQYLDNIKLALDSIQEITITDSWECDDNKDIHSDLTNLKDKIPSIKESCDSYVDFLHVTNTVYSDVAEDIHDSLRKYNGEE